MDGQGSCVLCVGFTHAMFRIAIDTYFSAVCLEFMNIHTMHMICHVCLFPLLVTSITVVILRPSVIDFAPTGSYIPYPLNLVSWSVHCTPQNRSAVLFNFLRIWDRFCCFFFRVSLSTSLAFSPFQTLKEKLELPLTLFNLDLPRPNCVIWSYPTISFGRTD